MADAALQQRGAVHAGHHHVGDEQVDIAGVLLDDLQRLLAVARLR